MGTLGRRVATTVIPIVLILLRSGFIQGQENALSMGKAGTLQMGMSIDDLYQTVGKQNTKLIDSYSEGYFSPVIEIYNGSGSMEKPALIAEVLARCPVSSSNASVSHSFVIGRISVNDARFKTNVGIGVGSTLGEIRRWYKVDWIIFGEGPLIARVEEIGMSFTLDYATPSQEWYSTHDPALIPDSARVTSVLLTLPPAAIASQSQRPN